MAEPSADLKKLVDVATDMGLSAELRTPAIKLIRNIGTYDSLVALLGLAANEQLTKKERQLAIKFAGDMIKSGH